MPGTVSVAYLQFNPARITDFFAISSIPTLHEPESFCERHISNDTATSASMEPMFNQLPQAFLPRLAGEYSSRHNP